MINVRLLAIWAVLLTVSVFAHAYVLAADNGGRLTLNDAIAIEISSHLVVAALLPTIYWLHRRWPIPGNPRHLLIHVAALVPFSLLHTVGMIGLRLLWFVAVLGRVHVVPLTWERLASSRAAMKSRSTGESEIGCLSAPRKPRWRRTRVASWRLA